MNHRQRLNAVLHYQKYDRLPVLHFGFWGETLQNFVDAGHLRQDEINDIYDGSPAENALAAKLGFDHNYHLHCGGNFDLSPGLEWLLIEQYPDGSRKVRNSGGLIIIEKPGTASIPAEVGHTLEDRASFDEHYRHRLVFSPDRMPSFTPEQVAEINAREMPLGIFCGSLYGNFRNWAGVVGTSYMYADDEDLFGEICAIVGDLAYKNVEHMLKSGIKFDFGHYWEDICYKNGPLVNPEAFEKYVGPCYKRISALLLENGIDIVSLDCDGMIDALLPTWFENGVNTMFPIEVGTWNASIAPWREKYGRELRGVGGMNKTVFAKDYKAVDAEIERLRGLVDLGGFIPCPDHRIAPDAKWENIQYYCDKMHKIYG